MFEKLFRKKKDDEPASTPPPSPGPSEGDLAMERSLVEKEKADADIRAKVCAGFLLDGWLLNVLRDEKGVRVQMLLGILGSLGGFACQMAVREHAKQTGKVAERNTLMEIESNNGHRTFFGDAPNYFLLEGPKSIWAIAAGGAHSLGVDTAKLRNAPEIAGHVAKTVGTDAFGVPRVPAGNEVGETPANLVKLFWPPFESQLARKYCREPSQWPLTTAIAIQRTMMKAKGAIDPLVAYTIVMECAVPAAKLDPRELGIPAPP